MVSCLTGYGSNDASELGVQPQVALGNFLKKNQNFSPNLFVERSKIPDRREGGWVKSLAPLPDGLTDGKRPNQGWPSLRRLVFDRGGLCGRRLWRNWTLVRPSLPCPPLLCRFLGLLRLGPLGTDQTERPP